MRVEFYGLAFETPYVTVHLASPWRATFLEHRLFDAVRKACPGESEQGYDEVKLKITEPKAWKAALQAVARVLKGWQEDADPGSERRSWRWLLEADTDEHGYDHYGESATVLCFVRLSLDRDNPDEPAKGEDIDLDGFSVRIWPLGAGR
jgi:hypothetical protein